MLDWNYSQWFADVLSCAWSVFGSVILNLWCVYTVRRAGNYSVVPSAVSLHVRAITLNNFERRLPTTNGPTTHNEIFNGCNTDLSTGTCLLLFTGKLLAGVADNWYVCVCVCERVWRSMHSCIPTFIHEPTQARKQTHTQHIARAAYQRIVHQN